MLSLAAKLQIQVGLQRTLDYTVVGLCRFHCINIIISVTSIEECNGNVNMILNVKCVQIIICRAVLNILWQADRLCSHYRLYVPMNCSQCQSPCETRMKSIGIH